MRVFVLIAIILCASVANAHAKIQIINFEKGVEIIVKKRMEQTNCETKRIKYKTKQINCKMKVSDIMTVHKVAKNIWVSYNKKDDKYTMRYVPIKEYDKKRLAINKMMTNIKKITEEVLVSIPSYPSKTFSLKIP